MEHLELPIIYAYLYRNILRIVNSYRYITIDNLLKKKIKGQRWINAICDYNDINGQIKGFNLGVSMAREEFLEMIGKWEKDNLFWNDNTEQYEHDGVLLDLSELKKQLGDKT